MKDQIFKSLDAVTSLPGGGPPTGGIFIGDAVAYEPPVSNLAVYLEGSNNSGYSLTAVLQVSADGVIWSGGIASASLSNGQSGVATGFIDGFPVAFARLILTDGQFAAATFNPITGYIIST